jgi:ecdysone 20-monooxygenase
METTILEKQDEAKDESVEAVFLSILRQKDLDIRDKKAAIVDFIAAGIHTVRESPSINISVVTNMLL